MSEERFDRIDQQLTTTSRRLDRIDERLDGIHGRLDGLDRRVDDLDRHMHVLHEDTLARIAAIPDNAARFEAKMAEGFADMKEWIGRRLDPLEATVRQHSVEIERLKKRRG